ncbi:hypothetical protein ONS95_010316 [Cadophora gregata]|uniref:uncharacterized protein n=1 Tax=Cadophora gregata TaxID=51156 RepID=UPI0026DBC844|nr:uncharacterized protein ONS95_010316 [Cadophora gregata]KAK0122052.1 hypothetical protein ONS95_010316 [Cadophora gregata]KAK0127528.1 hypothetical protein ONS96_007062 [Cadophora gregata f. sp. sojae]
MHLYGLEHRQDGGAPGEGGPGGSTGASSVVLSITSSITSASLTRTSSPGASATASSTTSKTSSASPTPTQTSDSSNNTPLMIPIIGAIIGVLALILGFYFIRRTRIKHKNPKYIPTPFLKKAWQKWNPSPMQYKLPNANESLEPVSTRTRASNRASNPPSSFDANAVANATAGVDRNTSVRSVMTLPAYRPNALGNEQVLGREGDRGGIDVVIEFPETQDDEELRREEEMEALYQVRLARRRENEEREERRRLRREARERGDYVALREITARARAASSTSAGQTVEELRAEHERIKKERQRAVSSVSYGDLGVARHDGTRLRANSQDSERQGLLGDAASIAASSRYHRRDRSTSSILSVDTQTSDLPSPGLTRSRATSNLDSPRRGSQQTERRPSTSNEGRAGSSPEMIEHEDVPPNSPPGYENISLDTPHDEHPHHEPPPDYTSPVLARGEQHPTIESSLPPTTTSPSTPVSPLSPGLRPSSVAISVDSRGSRRENRTDQLRDSRTSSSSSLSTSRPPNERRSSRGVGGVPQLPSLRLAGLPSIQVDPGSPQIGRQSDAERSPTRGGQR